MTMTVTMAMMMSRLVEVRAHIAADADQPGPDSLHGTNQTDFLRLLCDAGERRGKGHGFRAASTQCNGSRQCGEGHGGDDKSIHSVSFFEVLPAHRAGVLHPRS